MSNAIKRMKTKINKKSNEVYNTLVGSIVVSIGGIMGGLTEDEVRSYYNSLKKRKNKLPNTVSELVDLVWKDLGKEESFKLRANLVLVYDKLNIRTPLVTLVNSEGNLLPLKPNGEYTGILMTATSGSNLVNAEFLYTETGEEIVEEEENS